MTRTSSLALAPKPLLIGGRAASGHGEPIVSTNPATGETNYRVSSAAQPDVDHAVDVAARAAAQPAWRKLTAPQRAAYLYRIATLVERDTEVLARLQMQENGKVFTECRAQAQHAAATFRYYAALCETTGSELTPSRGEYLSMAVYEPYGVVAAITPWNSPMSMEAQKVAPALAAGNAVILKPSELTPSCALELGRIAAEAGLPAGLLSVLPGRGRDTGAALALHREVKMLSFTGGTATGRSIAAVAAAKLMPVSLELGGKSPHIVFADADLEAAANAIADGIFEGSGQSCVAGSRVFAQRSVYDKLLQALVAKAIALKVDLPDAPGAQMGPIASFEHRERIARMVEQARREGAEVVAGGRPPRQQHLDCGAFYMPTILVGMDNAASIAQQEIFGPVLCVMPFDDEEHVAELANASVFGLAAGIWTADFQRAWRVARALEAGTVWINTYKRLSIATPFGGFKDSGLGREKGLAGLRLYQQAKGIYVALQGN